MTFQYCLCLVDEAADGKTLATGRAALVNDKMWQRGSTLRVRFIEHKDEELHARIFETAQQWIRRTGCNLRFKRVDEGDSDIRISFSAQGSWSYLGTDAESHEGEATMNFGWLEPSSSEEDLRRVVLHEFGHALGLIHEHQNPEVAIPWDKEAVYEELKGSWSKSKIDHNLFAPYEARQVSTDGYDPKSIMHYPVPERWTRGDYEVKRNTDLSDGDIELIRRVYR